MTNLQTIERLMEAGGHLTVSEITKFSQGTYLINVIKESGVEVFENDLLLDVANQFSQNVGLGMNILFKLDEALVNELIKAIEGQAEAANKEGGATMDKTKVEKVIKFLDYTDEYRIEETLSTIIKDKPEMAEAVAIIKESGIVINKESTVLEVLKKIRKGKNTLTEALDEYGKTMQAKSTTKGEGTEMAGQTKTNKLNGGNQMESTTKLNGVNNTIAGGKEMANNNTNGGMDMTKMKGFMLLGLDTMIQMIAINPTLAMDAEFMAAFSQLKTGTKDQTVKSQKAEEKSSDNNIKGGETNMENTAGQNTEKQQGGTTMNKEQAAGTQGTNAGTTNKTEGGVKMEKVYRLSAAEKEGYFQTMKNLLDKAGEKAIVELEEIGVKAAVITYKEYKTLKDVAYRFAVVAGVEVFKSYVDNDVLETIGSVIQTYEVLRGLHGIYKICRAFNHVTKEDVEALNEVVKKINDEANSKLKNKEKDC